MRVGNKIRGHSLLTFTCIYFDDNATDIDECSGANDCEQGCTNTPGSYNCSCGSAFTLDIDGKSCNRKCQINC